MAPPHPPSSTATLVARYASRFNPVYAAEHGVTSPLGAWLLLALVAPAAAGAHRADLEHALGCGADEARQRAAALLSSDHPAVRSAAAVWARERFLDERFHRFAGDLPGVVARGPIPVQQQADAWAGEHTAGMIESFPLAVAPDTALLLATALATDVSWVRPFTVAPAARLGGEFGARVSTTLVAVDGHVQMLAATDAAGVVAVHAAAASAGLTVVSVIAEPSVPAGAVHAAAHEVGVRLAAGDHTMRISLFDLPLGDGHAWKLDETVEDGAGTGDVESCSTAIPAWDATSSHRVLAAPGFGALCATLDTFLRPEYRPGQYDALQVAVASFSRVGFRAAAITAVSTRAGAMPLRSRVRHRRADIRFNRPYAVVAIATSPSDGRGRGRGGPPAPWLGLPVFSAWVAAPSDAGTAH